MTDQPSNEKTLSEEAPSLPSLPHSIREINDLPEAEKIGVYKQLIPDWIYDFNQMDRETLLQNGKQVVTFRCPRGSRAMEIAIRYHPHELDPLVYLNMIDTFHNHLLVLLVIINNPASPRYYIDVDLQGHDTHLGTRSRNLPEEERAMRAGLAPGQVRVGLRRFRRTVPMFEDFVHRMGHDMFMIEPLAYHNAVIFEKYGFGYTYGQREMVRIHEGFQPGGELHKLLGIDRNPFRPADAWQTIRGRSWAIHDGILGHPFTGFQMYKRVGKSNGVKTFPDAKW